MSHRIACLFKPMLRLLRRPHRGVVPAAADRPCRCLDSSYVDTLYVSGPTAYHTGYQPPTAASLIAIFGIGVGSCGMLAVGAEGAR
ncbi:hypothetical protein Scel_58470 [Streptomyces cellostaticus]|nr:hypothetical protein Scel_58470 [Streptomyces cellostaticus]